MADTSPPSSPATFRTFSRMLRRRFWLLALCTLLVPASVVAYSLAQANEYEATASLLFRDSGPADVLDATPVPSQSQDAERMAATNLSLAGLERVASQAARRLGVAAGDVSARVQVSSDASSDVTTVTATDSSPHVAARLANTYAEEFIALRRADDVAEVRRVLDAVQTRLRSVQERISELDRTEDQGERARSLRAAERRSRAEERAQLFARQGELRSQASVATGNVELAQRALPPSAPIRPQTRRNAVLGVGLGLVLGLALALLFEMLDRRLRDPSELSELIDLPILGAIPHSRALAERPGSTGLPTAESQAFHMLRTNLRYYNDDRELGSLLVTSADPREGKTTVAWNLAVVSAQAGQSVLLLEADLRRPKLAARARVPADRGLSDVLRGEASLSDVVNEVVVGAHVNGASEPCTVDLVVAGALRGDVTGLIELDRMDAVIREAEERYELVVIDTPPMSVVPDAIPLMGKVSGVLVVTRLGTSIREAVKYLSSQLKHIRAPAVGAVVNGISRHDGYYGAAYADAREYRGWPGAAAEERFAQR